MFDVNYDAQKKVWNLSGIINESFSGDIIALKLGKRSPNEVMRFNLANLSSSNSIGIARFLQWIRESKHTLELEEIPFWIVEQINVIGTLSKNVHVVSLCVPFYCDETDELKEILLHTGTEVPLLNDYSDLEIGDRQIDGRKFVPDFDPEEAFSFLTHLVPP